MHSFKRIQDKIITQENLKSWAENYRPSIKNLVFTNGCFDIIHRGHITYLSQTADLGDKFIVALNTDASVSRLKGENRPVQDEYTRALVMAAFEFVDFVCFFDEDTPLNIIKLLLPNLLVKGGDYKVGDIVGYKEVVEAGGKVVTIDFVEGFSSSSIINSI
ncbi:MAG: D-glycero-beta-D-manno-heptose 1-phosphate adenylyltransferase [Bacteroidales bacterium]|jgi:rfaE bifunctional protein nucleotidyltransferase chain/domain|nr:D-glycero-beta-D-manno-heptose 1-phosphate adenylyltransferase [Bacteroidales bacterium]